MLTARAGLAFRQSLLPYMPPGIVSFDHAEAVNAFAQGQVSMITEWSAFYPTLVDPKTSKVVDCLAVAPEPAGSGRTAAGTRRVLAGGGGPGAGSGAEGGMAVHPVGHQRGHRARLCRGRRRVGAQRSIYQQPDIKAKYSFVDPMVASWQKGVPEFRPRFPAWPAISEVVAEWGSKIELGQVTPQEGSKEIGTRMEAILQKEGYYDGKKQKLQ